jgi:hypothetical protein
VAKLAEPVAPVALQRIMGAPRLVTPADVRVLQRTVGNRAVRRLVRPTLTILQVPPLQGGGRAGAASFSAAKAKAATHARQRRGPYRVGALGADFGYTDTEAVDANITALKVPNEDDEWQAQVMRLIGKGSLRYHLVPGCTEVTGPGGDLPGRTTENNWEEQVFDLRHIADAKPAYNTWYMKHAVRTHEEIHWKGMKRALVKKSDKMAAIIEEPIWTVTDVSTPKAAADAIKQDPDFNDELEEAREIWDTQYEKEIDYDHNNRTVKAERKIVNPMIKRIRRRFDPTWKK